MTLHHIPGLHCVLYIGPLSYLQAIISVFKEGLCTLYFSTIMSVGQYLSGFQEAPRKLEKRVIVFGNKPDSWHFTLELV